MKNFYERKYKKMTYEELSEIFGETPNKIHNIIVDAYNKIIDYYVEKLGVNIFDTVLFLCKFFNISEKEAFNNLNDKNKKKIKEYVLLYKENKEVLQ